MKNNGLVFLGFLLICLVNLSGKSSNHAVAPAAAVAPAPAPVPLPAPLKMNQSSDVDLRAAVLPKPQKLSDDN